MTRRTFVAILGNLTAFGPFVTDFYLPCLPDMAAYFSVGPSLIQTSLTAGMLGLAAGQLVVGPIADKYGRKMPLLGCLLLFVIATIGCMLSSTIGPFLFFRVLQGLTGSSGLVISKVLIADSFTSHDFARYFAFLAAVQGAAPIVAPVLGGMAFSLTSWQGAFATLGIWGFALLLACRRLDETLPPQNRMSASVWAVFKSYVAIGKNSAFMTMNLIQGFSSAALLAYISASPFIFQNHFGLTPLQYGVCFSANALGLVGGSALVMRLRNLPSALGQSVRGLVTASGLTAAALWLEWPFPAFEAVLFLMLLCVGMHRISRA